MRLKTLGCLLLFSLSACAGYHPKPIPADAPFLERIQTQKEAGLTVSVSALSSKESEKYFGLKLGKKGVQPVWLEIENREKIPYWLQAISIDPEYYPPNEVAHKTFGGHSKKAKKEIQEFLQKEQMPYYLPPGGEYKGFVYTNVNTGRKEVSVELWGPKTLKRFSFVVPVPGLRADFDYIDTDALYPKSEMKELDLAGLRKTLETLPAFTTDKKMKEDRGDPVNLVIVGDDEDLITAFVRRGWKETEIKYRGSMWRTFKSFIFKSSYDNSPVSDLYLEGRHQDIAFQKPRKTINNRNHLRLWMTPYQYKGKAVWIGAISRDIGVKFTFKSAFFVTHVIDSDVDESRDYLLQDFLAASAIDRWGYVKGVGAYTPEAPHKNFGGDEIYTDGLRLVMILGDIPVLVEHVQRLDWESRWNFEQK